MPRCISRRAADVLSVLLATGGLSLAALLGGNYGAATLFITMGLAAAVQRLVCEVSLVDEMRRMPVPLGWLDVDANEARLLRGHLVPALEAAEAVAQGRDDAKTVFEHLVELLDNLPAKNLATAASHLYPGNTTDEVRARKAWVTRMQHIIGWIKATRNLAAHGKYKPSPVEAFIALRTTLELLDALRPADKAVLCIECPSGETTEIELRRGDAKWLKELTIVCHEAFQQDRERSKEKQTKIETRLNHKLLEHHYKLVEQGRCRVRKAQGNEEGK